MGLGRHLSPVLSRELENLDKDAESRKNAMKALTSYVKNLDSKAIPLFLAQVSASRDPGSSGGECTISLYEVLARVHGRNIVPQIENIMSTILKTLSSSAGSFPLHQACAKVVPAIARYGIEPTTPQDEKTRIIMSLCKPLADVLMGTPESLSFGSALCLRALVESDNWRFASNYIVNELCLKVASALEENSTQTNAHMGLTMALVKHNGIIAEAYARSLLKSALQILVIGISEGNSQKRFSAIQMISFLMKSVDSRSISSELADVVEIMERCQGDPMPYIKGAAFEALQTAKFISMRIVSRYELSSSPLVGSNFVGGYSETEFSESHSLPVYLSPESHTLDSFIGHHGSLLESPLSNGQSSCNLGPGKRTSRRIWNNGHCLDVSLKDGRLPGSASCCYGSRSFRGQFDNANGNDAAEEDLRVFSGFGESVGTNLIKHDSTMSPRRPRSPLSVHDPNIFTTPRRLLRSLQGETNDNSRCRNDRHGRVPRSPVLPPLDANPITEVNTMNNYSHHLLRKDDERDTENLIEDNDRFKEPIPDHSESISSNDDHPIGCTVCSGSCKNCAGAYNGAQSRASNRGKWSRPALSLVFSLFVALPVIAVSVMWMDDAGQNYLDMVPT